MIGRLNDRIIVFAWGFVIAIGTRLHLYLSSYDALPSASHDLKVLEIKELILKEFN